MPFDGKDFPLIAVPTVKPFDFDTATPDERLLELARLLENEQEWRDGRMVWDFWEIFDHWEPQDGSCGTAGCAIGLALLSFPSFSTGIPEVEGSEPWWGAARIRFDLTNDQMDALFAQGLANSVSLPMAEVQPIPRRHRYPRIRRQASVMTTLAELNAREAQVKGQIHAVDLACKSAISRLMEELDQISDQKIAILGREIEEEDRLREMRRAA